MVPVIHCKSSRFDIDAEPPNPINPIPGRSILVWLGGQLARRISLSEPEPEDWGWYSTARVDEASYLVGACAHPSADGHHEWVIQIDRHRSMLDRILGRSRMSVDDPCFRAIEDLISRDPSFTDLSVELGR